MSETVLPVGEGQQTSRRRTSYRLVGHGEPVVFIHGVGMNKDVWTPQVDEFARSHTVLTYDMLGHGGSTLPGERPALADYCAQLFELLDDLAIARANIIGHSMGGLVAMDFAARHADRVLRLVVMNSV